MRNNKFKLSDMIPNAWFYKLKEIGKPKNQTSTTTTSKNKKHSSPLPSKTTSISSKPNPPNQNQYIPRKSYYFTRNLNQNNNIKLSPSSPPKTPSKNRTRKTTTTTSKSKTCSSSPKLVTSSVSADCSCRTTLESVWTKSETLSSSPLYESESIDTEFRTDRVLLPNETSFDEMVSLSISSCPCNNKTSNNNINNINNNNNNVDIVIDVDKNSLPRKDDKLDKDYNSYKLELPPIITKPQIKKEHKPEQQQQKNKNMNMNKNKNRNINKIGSVNSPGMKLRIKSPRIGNKKLQIYHSRKSVSSTTTTTATVSGGYYPRRSFSGSVAIVKSSFNPQKDFRESMVEMILENNIRESKDLEDLLACYLSLNSDEYHQLIIKVFKQIWFDLTENRN